ncbi:MAG: superoxide dismutase family protein [Planctomycetota bacterium]
MRRDFTFIPMLFTLTLLTACGGHGHDHGSDQGDTPSSFDAVSKAVCVLSPTEGSELPNVSGRITFTQTKSGLLVEATLRGLKPNSKHGLHIHEWGDVSAADGSATGGPFDPQGIGKHALPDIHSHGDVTHALVLGHAGALGNIQTDAQGNASYTMSYENLSLTKANAMLGRSVIIHRDEDTGEPPSSDAGAFVAQGVIGVADPD